MKTVPDLPTFNAAAELPGWLPGLIIIGTDGSREMLALDNRSEPSAVVLVDLVFSGWDGAVEATCPITQGSVMRLLIREGQSAATARAVLSAATAAPRHEFWPDDIEYASVPGHGIIGHRQVTDAYLAQLARARGARLATFDQALAKLHDDVADLVPDS